MNPSADVVSEFSDQVVFAGMQPPRLFGTGLHEPVVFHLPEGPQYGSGVFPRNEPLFAEHERVGLVEHVVALEYRLFTPVGCIRAQVVDHRF